MIASNFYVYVHSRLNTGDPFYIGKGRSKRCISEHDRNRHWKHIVAKDGGFVTSFLVHGVDNEFATMAEIDAIDIYRRRGIPLVNVTAGGEGVSGLKHSEESRLKMSKAHKGAKLSESHRLNAAAARIGKPVSQLTRDKISASNKGTKPTAFAIQRSIETKLGTRHSEEWKARVSNKLRGRRSPTTGMKFSDATRAKKAASMKKYWIKAKAEGKRQGMQFSDSTRAKLSAATAAYWVRKKASA